VNSTEIVMANGDRYEVTGDPSAVEEAVVGAARGSIMALAWLTEVGSGSQIGVNPDQVVAIRRSAD
jgi:hypothetical protein